MLTAEPRMETLAIDLARECLYRFLAGALSAPGTEGWQRLLDSESRTVAREAADLLRAEAEAHSLRLGFGELPAGDLTLEPLLTALDRPPADLRAEYDRVFGLVFTRECPTYETEYHPNTDPFFRSQQMADVAGFYRAFGLTPTSARPERPDHIALELDFMAFLLLKKRLAQTSGEPGAVGEHVQVCDETMRKFFDDHLVWWVPSFAAALRRKAAVGLYCHVARVLAALVPLERSGFGLPPPRFPLQPQMNEQPEEALACAGCSHGAGG
jgi:TorA maturation chaperone TorD